MKKRNRDFSRFCKTFQKYQTLLGLSGYKVYFKHEPLEDVFADICCPANGQTATVRYNSTCPEGDKPFNNPALHAKHEALHLLTSRLENCGRSRYIRSDEIYEATEELVRKLENLIP